MRPILALIFATWFSISLQAVDQPPVQISAELGFSNLFLPSRPFPFQVDLISNGKAIEGELTLSCPSINNGRTIYTLPISLAPGARKRWKLTLPPMANTSIHATLRDSSGKIIIEQDIFGMLMDADAPLLVVVQGSGSNRFVFPRKDDAAAHGEWRTGSITPESLPEDPLAYAGVSAILWRSDTPQPLNQMQSIALLDWLRQGGILVVAGGRTVPPNLPKEFSWPAQWEEMTIFSLGDLKDATLSTPVRPLTLLRHEQPSIWEKGTLPSSTVAISPLKSDGVSTRLETGGVKLITEQIVDGGALMQLAFDPGDLAKEGAVLDHSFWEQALFLPSRLYSPWDRLYWLGDLERDQSHTILAQIADYRVASLSRVSTVFGLFFGLAFCLNFWLFRKSRRYEWAWLILIVASISLFFYNRAYGRVGGFGPTRHVETSQSIGIIGDKNILTFTEVGLLSPRTRTESLTTAARRQILFGLDNETREVRVTGENQTITLEAQAGAFATCASVTVETLPGEGITAKWERTDTEITARLTNKTGLALGGIPITQIPGSTVKVDGNDVILKIPVKALEAWLVSTFTQMTQNGNQRYRSYNQYYYGGQNPLVVPFTLQLQMPSTGKPMTSGHAVVGQCYRTLTLLLPIPVDIAKIPHPVPQAVK